MSFRELRNFAEFLRILGFKRQVSIENFRSPNFPLVSEILAWLCTRFDPNIEVNVRIDTEFDRVAFIRTVAQILAVKGNIRLNTKKLYLADGRAVQEMLRVVTLLYQAQQTLEESLEPGSTGQSDSGSPLEVNEGAIRDRLANFEKLRRMASAVTMKGAKLYDDLAQEPQMREQRLFVVNRPLSLPEVEEGIKEAIKSAMQESDKVTERIESISADEAALESKIEKKKEDLERYRKRLEALKSVRPAFMDEFERLEQELKLLFDDYVLKHRCLVFLEQQLEEVEKAELEHTKKREASIREIISSAHEKSLFEEDKYNGGGAARSSLEEDDDEEDGDEQDDDLTKKQGTAELSLGGSHRKLINSLTATRGSRGSASGLLGVAANEIGDMDSLDSDIDLGADDASDLDSEEELDLLHIPSANRSNGTTYATSAAVSSGEDGRANRAGHRSGRVTVAPNLPLEETRETKETKSDSDDDF